MFKWFAFVWCFKDHSLILFSECDAAKNIRSFLGICRVLHSQAKSESCKLFGKNSSSLGIWAGWDLGLGKHWLQWFFRHFNVSICHTKCWSDRVLWIAGTAASVSIAVLSSVWLLTCCAVLFPQVLRLVTMGVRRGWLCLRAKNSCKRLLFLPAVIWSTGGPCWCDCFAVSLFIVPTLWKPVRIMLQGCANRMHNHVGTRVSVTWVSSRTTRTCRFSYALVCAADLMACVSTHCCLVLRAAEKDRLTGTSVLVLVFQCCLLFPGDIMLC